MRGEDWRVFASICEDHLDSATSEIRVLKVRATFAIVSTKSNIHTLCKHCMPFTERGKPNVQKVFNKTMRGVIIETITKEC